MDTASSLVTPLPPLSVKRSWLRTLHAVTALVLMVLFFVAAAAAAAGLMYLGYHVGLGALTSLRGKAMLFGALLGAGLALAGLVVAWSLVPRLDRFEAPGPELHRDQHPQLFREIDRVAAMTGEAAPKHVYLVGDVNAFVAERGGFAGLGARRVMGLGLPLLGALSVSQLRAVLAHEFGHFAGGDTSLGRWIHKTRLALLRTLNNLGETHDATSELGATFSLVFVMVHAPFRWFFSFYLRFTQSLSRRQEFDADALAVQLEGTRALTEGLVKVRQTALAWEGYRSGELEPLLARGVLPPVSAGFTQFLGAEPVKLVLSKLLDASDGEAADPFDSHPPLHERLAAAQALNRPARSTDERLGVELLADVPTMEAAVAQTWVSEGTQLSRITWEGAGAPLEAQWRESLKALAPKFAGYTLSSLSRERPIIRGLVARAFGAEAADAASDDELKGWAAGFYALALQVALLQQGFRALNRPGQPVALSRGDEVVEPSKLVTQLLEGELSGAAWHAQLAGWAVAGVDLGTLAG